ncbi:MAG: right-handed parallel beta-helix repeat-containing protein [Candidatus Krumholzibacteria bacterium]|nr:right-handed parallel beta-helix repeat-containing protein [Candidatus Krumholzibacteria bacterium]
MSNSAKFCIVILSIALGAFPTAAARSAHYYVGDGDATALQQNLYDAPAGDTIIVGPGTYALFGSFEFSHPLHLISEKGPSETIIANYGGCIGVGGPCIGSNGFIVYGFTGSFTIKGFTIRDHQSNPISLVSDGAGIRAFAGSGIITDNIFSNNETGIYMVESPGVVIENNLIQTTSGVGLIISSDASADIRFNTIVNNGYNVWLVNPVSVSTVVRNNIIAQAGHWGVYIKGGPGTVSLSCNDIWGNASGTCTGLSTDCIGVDGNISLDPLFCSGYYLHQESSCLGANTPALCNGDHMGCYPIACEVATQKQSWGKVKSIFR